VHTHTKSTPAPILVNSFSYTNNISKTDPSNFALYSNLLKVNAVTHHKTGQQMEYRQLTKDPEYRDTWLRSFADEIGNLFQGIGENKDGSQRVKGTDTLFWITKAQVPKGRTATFARIVCDHRPQKIDRPNRTRITACGNFIKDYPGEVSTDTAGLETIKIHWDSTIPTPGAKYMTIDISNCTFACLSSYDRIALDIKDPFSENHVVFAFSSQCISNNAVPNEHDPLPPY